MSRRRRPGHRPLFVKFQEALEKAGVGQQGQRKTYGLLGGMWARGMRWHPRLMTRNVAIGADKPEPMSEDNDKNRTRRAWRDACEEAARRPGLAWLAKARVYDLRHSAISHKPREHFTTTEVAGMARNTAGQIERRYAHVIAEAEGQAAWNVDAVITQAREQVAAAPVLPPVEKPKRKPRRTPKPTAAVPS